ncbi:MAG: hypothetical protein H7Y07_14880 [Pyrinomonadaceae bacterium]|nr:hypothetical protein [Sphingobacteriaceae bacterium]
MPAYRLKYSPKFIIYLCICNYLNEEQVQALRNELSQKKLRYDKDFLRVIKRYIDLELLREKPIIWQDIWVYNYLIYDATKSKFPRKGLIVKYEKEIISPQKIIMDEVKMILMQG